MRKITEIFIHIADTPATMDIGVKTIRKWHTDPKPKGRGWKDVGYHFIVRRSGTTELGRDVTVPGAHAKGHNAYSIGICLVGRGFNLTAKQKVTLKRKIAELIAKYPGVRVRGHNEIDMVRRQWCPGFDVQGWMKETFPRYDNGK